LFPSALTGKVPGMCRMLVVRGKVLVREVIREAVAMSTGATADHERCEDDGRPWVHLDGWGLLLRAPTGEWHCFRGGDAISPEIEKQLGAWTETDFAIAHVRKASDPQYLGPAFAHPVELRRDSRSSYFCHNGYAPDVGALLGKPEGWDSERLLEYVLPALGGPEKEVRGRLDGLPDSTTCANFIYADGDEVTVANWFPANSEFPRYYGLRYAATADRVLIASDPLPSLALGEPLRMVKNGAVARFGASTPVEEIVRALARG
jgi:hypothetical protein